MALSWPKLGLEPKFHDPGTFGGFGKHGHTNTQDSCFISIDQSYIEVGLCELQLIAFRNKSFEMLYFAMFEWTTKQREFEKGMSSMIQVNVDNREKIFVQ